MSTLSTSSWPGQVFAVVTAYDPDVGPGERLALIQAQVRHVVVVENFAKVAQVIPEGVRLDTSYRTEGSLLR